MVRACLESCSEFGTEFFLCLPAGELVAQRAVVGKNLSRPPPPLRKSEIVAFSNFLTWGIDKSFRFITQEKIEHPPSGDFSTLSLYLSRSSRER